MNLKLYNQPLRLSLILRLQLELGRYDPVAYIYESKYYSTQNHLDLF